MLKIGEEFKDTESFGSVKIDDIFISPTTNRVVYQVRSLDDDSFFLCAEDELTDNDPSSGTAR